MHLAMMLLRENKDKEGIMRLLMYYDGTDDTRKTLKTVKERAKALQAKVHVLSSLSNWGELSVKIVRKMEDGLHYIKNALNRENIPCDTHLLIMGRTPGEDILDAVDKFQVNEIIIGIGRTSKIKKFKARGLIKYLISRARCSVHIV